MSSIGRGIRSLRDWMTSGSEVGSPTISQPKPMKHIAALGEPPDDLLRAAADGSCVIFAGEELSRGSGMPLWRTFVLGFIDRLYDTLVVTSGQAGVLRVAHRRGECDDVARKLAPVALANLELLNEYALTLYRKPAALTQLHEAVADSGARAFISANLDSLMERCLGIEVGAVFTPAESEAALSCLLSREFFGLKLRGTFEKSQSLRVWPSDAQEANAANPDFRRLVGHILTDRTLLCVGASVEEISEWLPAPERSSTPARRHYALLSKTDTFHAKRAQALSARFNIQCMTYAPAEVSQVVEFLSKVRATSPSRT